MGRFTGVVLSIYDADVVVMHGLIAKIRENFAIDCAEVTAWREVFSLPSPASQWLSPPLPTLPTSPILSSFGPSIPTFPLISATEVPSTTFRVIHYRVTVASRIPPLLYFICLYYASAFSNISGSSLNGESGDVQEAFCGRGDENYARCGALLRYRGLKLT